MPTVIPVRMHFNVIDLWFNPKQSGAQAGDHVVVSTERGTEIGLATADPFEAPSSEVKGELKPVLRVATEEDLARAEELSRKSDEAMPVFRELVKASGLDMKPVGVEFLFGGEKAVFYFAAEDRVDFRDLVRELASRFHQRVDMRQIGVRDEARLVGGYAPCGQELCCVRFGGEFEPVSIRMAKEQDLPLNSAKISGVCGRLMCCLRYEFEAYRDFKQRAPKKNALIDTPLGKAKIVEYNTPRETLTLRLENGKSFTVALKDMSCSEGCCKRSAEQHIPLRPDTVTREALEALGTPDIIMQLAELDRANAPEGAYVLDDSLLETRRQPRRRTPVAEQPAVPDAAPRRKRGRTEAPDDNAPSAPERGAQRRKAAAPDAEQQGAAQARRTRKGAPAQDAPGQDGQERRQPRGGGMRPRRTGKGATQGRPSAKDPQTEAQPTAQPRPERASARPDAAKTGAAPQQQRRTRRHHTTADGAPAAAPGARPARDGQRPDAAPRPQRPAETERPQTGTAEQAGTKRRRTRTAGPSEGGKQAKGGSQQASPGAAPRPTRRRRPGDKGGPAQQPRDTE